MDKKSFVCIVCPMGCQLTVEGGGDDIHVSGNECPRGMKYGIQEATRPMRMVTSSIAVIGGRRPLCSVKTAHEIDKSKISEAVARIKTLRVSAPIKPGQVIDEDLVGTGVALVATAGVDIC